MRQDSYTYYRVKKNEAVLVIVAAFGCGPNQVTAALSAGTPPTVTPSSNATSIAFKATGKIGDRRLLGIGVSFLSGDTANASFAINLSGSLGGGAFYGGTLYRPSSAGESGPITASYYFEIV